MRRSLLGLAIIACAPLIGVGCNTGTGPPNDGLPKSTIIQFISAPAGARVWLNGSDTGFTTPVSISGISSAVLGTENTFRLRLAGYHDYNGLVTTYADRPTTVAQADLVATSVPEGSARVESTPAGARILLDGADTGRTTPAAFPDLGPTRHVVTVRLTGYNERTEEFDVTSGEQSVLQLELQRQGADALGGVAFSAEDGSTLFGARVWIPGTSFETTTGQFGSYVFENVPPGTYDVLAEKTLNDGRTFVGAVRDVVVGDQGDRHLTAHLLMAPEGQFARVSGTVLSTAGQPLQEAWVSALLVIDGVGVASVVTRADANGAYSLTDLPAAVYDIVAGGTDSNNAGQSAVALTPGQAASYSFRLGAIPSTQPLPSAPQFDGAPRALTYPRAADVNASAYLAVREAMARASGLPDTSPRMRVFDDLRAARAKAGARGIPPADSNIEIELFWLANPEADIGGYNIYRSTDPDLGFRRALQVADPNAIWVADHSRNLGAGVRYYYDMDAYSTDGSLSDVSESVWTVPLDRLRLAGPADGAAVGPTPVFAWEPLGGTALYELFVFGAPPDFDARHEPNVAWHAASIPLSATSIPYGSSGSAEPLVSGHTYYWVLTAYDSQAGFSSAGAVSISPIRRFTVH
ncbi:MAG TPA: carboxypeptidase regulatory-like domain-containing protein [Armatimonadota bacterium]|nr:carboxypeptidase regulatory-like domain-containing protein [Armatimonadota bacterium]